jgi:hypothetical protein
LVSHNFFCHFNTGIFKMARTKQVPAKDDVAKAAAAPVKSMDVVGSPRRSVKDLRKIDTKTSTKGSRRVCELRVIKCHEGIQFWYIGVPSKATVEGYSKGFLDAVNSSDQEFEEWDLIFVGELRADPRSDIPLKNHRGYWWRGAIRLLDEAESDEETRTALCKVAEVSKK